MKYINISRKYELEEFGLDIPTEEIIEEEHPKLMLVKTSYLRDHLSPSPIHATNAGNEFTEESEQELYSEPQGRTDSSLVIYFKTINKFPLLREEEERILAKRIKETGEECKNLAIKWKHLFNKEFLSKFSAKQIKEIREKLKPFNGSFHLFDDLAKLDRKQKKISRTIKRQAKRSTPDQKLQMELYRVEGEISKRIAEINLSKMSIDKLIRSLKKISHTKKNTEKQQILEKALRKILRGICKLSKEMKVLKNELAHANLRLVISIAKKYVNCGLTLSDLIQEGNLGLTRAIDTYDYRRGHRFITYGTWWIRQAIIRALDSKSKTIRTPVYMNERLHQITKASNRLLQEYKREPTLEEIAEETNTSLEFIEKVLQSFKDSTSLDALIEEKGESLPSPVLGNEDFSALGQVISTDLSQIIELMLSDLTLRERKIVKLRFGIGDDHDHTLEEIGCAFNLSRERIRQILEIALNKLKAPQRIMKLKEFMSFN